MANRIAAHFRLSVPVAALNVVVGPKGAGPIAP